MKKPFKIEVEVEEIDILLTVLYNELERQRDRERAVEQIQKVIEAVRAFTTNDSRR